jgi:hypothetical protein
MLLEPIGTNTDCGEAVNAKSPALAAMGEEPPHPASVHVISSNKGSTARARIAVLNLVNLAVADELKVL